MRIVSIRGDRECDGEQRSAVCTPSTLYWIDRINYLTAGLLAIITEKQWTASGRFPQRLYVNTHLGLVGSADLCGAHSLKQGHVEQVIYSQGKT